MVMRDKYVKKFFTGVFERSCQNGGFMYFIRVWPSHLLRWNFFNVKQYKIRVSRLHDTVAKFRTGVKFSLQYNNWGELTPVGFALA